MKLVLDIRISKLHKGLDLFMHEFFRLAMNKKIFSLTFRNGNKLYISSCKGLQKDVYLCVFDRDESEFVVSAINLAIALQTDIEISYTLSGSDNIIRFYIESDNESNLQTLINFCEQMECNYITY